MARQPTPMEPLLKNPTDRGARQATVYKDTGLQRADMISDLAHSTGDFHTVSQQHKLGMSKLRLTFHSASCSVSQHTEAASLHASHVSTAWLSLTVTPHSALLLSVPLQSGFLPPCSPPVLSISTSFTTARQSARF